MNSLTQENDSYIDLLAEVDQTYAGISEDDRLAIEELSKNLPRTLGQRLARRAGFGMQPMGPRHYDPERGDELKHIHARLSAKGPLMVLERELERKHRVSLWRDPTMPDTKKRAAEISLLALAEKLARDEDSISVLHDKQLHRMGRDSSRALDYLQDVTVIGSDQPEIEANIPRNSTFFLFGQFFSDRDNIENILNDLYDRQLNGYLVMMLDPSETEFDLPDNVKIFGPNGEKTLTGQSNLVFSSKAAVEQEWFKRLSDHLDWLDDVCEKNGFKLILQRTDEPLEKGLTQILGNQFPNFAETIPKLKKVS